MFILIPGLSATRPPAPPAVPTQWTNGDGDSLWENPLNWTDGVPDATKDCIMGGISNADCITPDFQADCKTFDGTGYTGNLSDNATGNTEVVLYVNGSVTLNSGMGTPGIITVRFYAPGQFTGGGFPRIKIFSFALSNVVEFTDDLTVDGITIHGGTVNFNNHVMTIPAGATSSARFSFENCTIQYSAGAKLRVARAAGDAVLHMVNGGVVGYAPPTEILAGAYGGQFNDTGWKTESWTQAAGTWVSGNTTMLVSGNFLITGGNFQASVGQEFTLNVAGSCQDTGGAPSTIARVNCTGTAMTATGCTDGGGNTNVNF